jgi:hypothetical protein
LMFLNIESLKYFLRSLSCLLASSLASSPSHLVSLSDLYENKVA